MGATHEETASEKPESLEEMDLVFLELGPFRLLDSSIRYLSARRAREHRKHGAVTKRRGCRCGRPPIGVTDDIRRWWPMDSKLRLECTVSGRILTP
jgi:hypothetical protein